MISSKKTTYKMKTNNEVNDSRAVKFEELIAEPIPPGDQACSLTMGKYAKIGFEIPWVEYSFKNELGQVVGYGGFMGPPSDGEVEIDYILTFDQELGVEKLVAIYTELVEIAYKAQENIRVVAQGNPLDLDSDEVFLRSGFLPYNVSDNPISGGIQWIHKKHLEWLASNLQPKYPASEEPMLAAVELAIEKYELIDDLIMSNQG